MSEDEEREFKVGDRITVPKFVDGEDGEYIPCGRQNGRIKTVPNIGDPGSPQHRVEINDQPMWQGVYDSEKIQHSDYDQRALPELNGMDEMPPVDVNYKSGHISEEVLVFYDNDEDEQHFNCCSTYAKLPTNKWEESCFDTWSALGWLPIPKFNPKETKE